MADLQVTHAYRHMYRWLLRAVQFSKPARYIARDQLRVAFREQGGVLDSQAIGKTLRFLESASKSRGIEHKIVKNLLFITWHRNKSKGIPWKEVQQRIKREKEAKKPQSGIQNVNLQTEKTNANTSTRSEAEKHVSAMAYQHYDMTIAMLNKSMGLCLR